LILFGLTGPIWGSFIGSKALSIDKAHGIAERYLISMDDQDLVIAEVMEFEENFYVIYNEKSTRVGAFEMLIDKVTGRIFPEYGPNMMWNARARAYYVDNSLRSSLFSTSRPLLRAR